MKQFCVLKEQTFRKIKHPTFCAYFGFAVIISTLFLAACGGKLGTIESQDVETQLIQAEQEIRTARDANAHSLAFEEFEKAETYLEQAKDAFKEKNGIDALKFANKAIAHAKIAKRKSTQNTTNAEYNAKILEKDALITELKKDLSSNERKHNELETEVQQLRDTERTLQNNIATLEKQNQELVNSQGELQQKIAEVNTSLTSIRTRAARYENEVKTYGNKVNELTRKVNVANTMMKSANKQKRAAIAEAASVKKQMREQAKIFTDKLVAANKKNIATEHTEYLRKAAAEARAFEKELHSNEPKRTGRTSLSTQQINAGKASLNQWESSWNSKNLDAHFAHYTPNISTNKIVTIESKENQGTINRGQMETDLREMNTQTWEKFDSTVEAEQESVIGTYRYRRLVSAAETEDDTALYDIWFREIWIHQVQGKWKAYREIWQIYKNVPKF